MSQLFAINLNHPQHYVHWSIFTVSIANLIIILTMVVIFGLALLLPFPKAKQNQLEPYEPPPKPHDDQPSYIKKQWTYKLRSKLIKIFPPNKLLPDRQPAYVASWIYVFGVATLVALAIVIISGTILAIGGVSWWHTSSVGHFTNSVHLWSVELFMAFMVIHLWGKFWMAAWRGNRALTWMTGVLAFAASILECFTGYLSQQNFDSQWIATNGKDAINATGLGSFFNLMNFGQMLTWHIVIMPLILIVFVAAHILMVRAKGVAHPIMPAKGKKARLIRKAAEASDWHGPSRPYDILKEAFFAGVIVLVVVLILAGTLSSPDDPPLTVQTWAKLAPADFMGTTVSELNGTSETAQYGQPYNQGTASVQKIVVSWQKLAGVHQAINPAQTFVLYPLGKLSSGNVTISKALATYVGASDKQQQAWLTAYSNVLNNVKFINGQPVVAKANDGPVPTLVNSELSLAQNGAIDANLLSQQPFYGSDYTKPLLFMEDGNYFSSIAQADHLTGSQWGVMNETGSYPGQPWLWLYTLWYQIPSFSSSANIDLIAIYLTGIATLLLLLVPFIPGLRDIPRLIPVHKLIWRGQTKSSHKE